MTTKPHKPNKTFLTMPKVCEALPMPRGQLEQLLCDCGLMDTLTPPSTLANNETVKLLPSMRAMREDVARRYGKKDIIKWNLPKIRALATQLAK